MIFDLLYPQALILAVPVAAILWKIRARRKLLLVLQIAIAALIVLMLAQPRLRMREKGTDLVLVVDRSSSMPAGAAERVGELIMLAGKARGPGDRMAVVTFGDGARVQMLPDASEDYSKDPKPTPPEASDLAGGLESALAIVPADRPGRILLLSDGEYTGNSPIWSGREAGSRGLPIDYRQFSRVQRGDLAVERLVLPERVNSGEPFQFSAVVQADQATAADYVLLRGDKVLARGRSRFVPGGNRLVFRDILSGQGICEYRLKLLTDEDPRQENNLGRAVVEVVGAPALMLVNASGADDNLTRSIKKARIPVKVFSEDTASFSLDNLQGYRGVILENVPAEKVGRLGMSELSRFVELMGGAIWAESIFGKGSKFYFALPVSKKTV